MPRSPRRCWNEINAIASSPYWPNSVIIITYDETDGLYDHADPHIRAFDPEGSPLAGGPRIPGIVISPFSRVHGISHEYAEHSSVIKFIDELHGLTPLADLPDEARARELGESEFGQSDLGPADDKVPEMGNLISAFDNARLLGQDPPLPPGYAEIPRQVVMSLPHYGGNGCATLHIVPTDYVAGQADRSAASGFQSAAGDDPRHSNLGHLDAVTLARGSKPRTLTVDGWCLMVWVLASSGAAVSAGVGAELDAVRTAGRLSCGIVTEPADYTKDDTHANLAAFDLDLCKAVAAAVLGDGERIRVSAFPDERHGLAATKAGQIDLLAAATPSASKAVQYAVGFAAPVLFDGRGFLAAKAAGIASINDLSGKQVCFISGTEAETALDAALRQRNITVLPFPFEELGEMEAALATGHCAAITADVSQLALTRSELHRRANNFTLLPELITVDPLAPAYRQGDPQWAAIVSATIDVLLAAEASDITRATIASMPATGENRPGFLVNASGASAALGLDDDRAVHVIKAVGNYAELFARDLGEGSPLGLPRGRNALSSNGGLLHPRASR